MEFKGFVSKLLEKNVTSKKTNKQFVAYSVKIEQENGVEYDQWFDFGFDRPPFNEGDYITFSAGQQGKYWSYAKGTGRVVKNPPARNTAKPTSEPVSGPTVHGPAGGEPAAQAAGTDRQSQIVAQHSQEVAIRRLAVFLEYEALPMTEAKTKSGTAKRFDELSAMLHKFEVEAYNDVTAGRIATGAVNALETPAEDKKGDSETPQAAEDAKEGVF